jgi:DNA-binding transcriptional ArsR family regulator
MTERDSDRRQHILDYINDSVATRGYPPSVSEIGEAVGLASKSAVHHHLTTLEREGKIQRDPGQSRALRVIEPRDAHLVTANDERAATTAAFLDDVLATLADGTLPLKERAGWYAMLRPLRLKIDRALRPMTHEITDAMVSLGARRWGPLKIVMRSKDVKYTCNDLGNWQDGGVQSQLETWREHGAYRPFIRDVPRHYEVDTIALRDAMQQSDPGAFELYQLLNEKGFRTTDGKEPTLAVEGG